MQVVSTRNFKIWRGRFDLEKRVQAVRAFASDGVEKSKSSSIFTPHIPKPTSFNLSSIKTIPNNLASSSLPFRFKAGGDGGKMPSAVASHSHRATTKVNNKAFKSRKATKGAMRDQLKGKMSHAGQHSQHMPSWALCAFILAHMTHCPSPSSSETLKKSRLT